MWIQQFFLEDDQVRWRGNKNVPPAAKMIASPYDVSEEAVAILQAEQERGHVHHAFFKDAMLQRFYAICNYCSCCCGAMQAQRNGTPMLASSGYVSRVDEDACIALSLIHI